MNIINKLKYHWIECRLSSSMKEVLDRIAVEPERAEQMIRYWMSTEEFKNWEKAHEEQAQKLNLNVFSQSENNKD